MKKSILLLLALLFKLNYVAAQWAQKASLPGTARAKSSSFVVGSKLYVIGGIDAQENPLNDVWEYDMTNDTWMQKPNFPGPARFAAVAFSIGNKGYYGTGDAGNTTTTFSDMWEYDPITGIWAQKAYIPYLGGDRAEAFAFTIGNKAYVGGGMSANNGTQFDLLEFDPMANTWTYEASVPGWGRTMAASATINNKVYIGLGWNGNSAPGFRSMFEYDPAINLWRVLANFPSTFSADVGMFALNSKIYLAGGADVANGTFSNQFYQYDPQYDSWAALPNFNGGKIVGELAVSTGTRAFIGMGFTASMGTRTDLWEVGTIVAPPTNTVTNPPPTPTLNTTGINSYLAQSIGPASVNPNPAQNEISVNISKKIISLEIIDMTGKTVVKETSGLSTTHVGNLCPGIYVIRINCEDGTQSRCKFIKN
jgi:N-acetylneuraminic acid mutarotase